MRPATRLEGWSTRDWEEERREMSCEIWFRSVEEIGTDDAFRNWESRIVAAFAEFDPPPTELHCEGYKQDGAFGRVTF
jgi:hypothetical protein